MAKETMLSGILVINKHEGVTSHDIVSKVRRLYGTKQVGHTGTLDPMATGVLPVLVGRAVKASEFILAENKRYTAGLRLGIETDTEDTTGTVTAKYDVIPDEDAVLDAVSKFIGDTEQIPPMYSALKVNGRKLVDLARDGMTVERQARPIHIESITAEQIADASYRLDVRCSKGTYIRTLCADIGRSLGCGGVMESLCRTESGPFTLAEAYTVEQLEAMTEEEREMALIPLERFFEELSAVDLSDFYARLARNGAEIYLRKIKCELPLNTMVRVKHGGEFFALGRVQEFDEGYAIKVLKLFVL